MAGAGRKFSSGIGLGLTAAPPNPNAGDMYYNTVTGLAMLYNGTGWDPVITGGAPLDTELTTKDYDTGGGTDTVATVGILLPKAGGSVAGGTATDPIRVDPTGQTAQGTIPQLSKQTVTLTRPANATAYTTADVIANSTSAPVNQFVTGSSAASGSGVIRGLTVWGAATTTQLGLRLRLYFYSAAPTAIADNAAFSANTDIPDFWVDMPPFVNVNLGSARPASTLHTVQIPYLTDAAGKLYFVPVLLHGWTPISAYAFTFLFQLNRS